MQSIWRMVVVVGVVATSMVLRAQDVQGDQETVRRALHVCAACHGEGGRSETKSVPSLAGQQRLYTIAQLKDFRSQTRAEAGVRAYMWGVSALLDDAMITGLADDDAAQKPAPGKPGHPALVRAGKKIFEPGLPGGVRACAGCHGETGEGAAGFPRLAGQRADHVFDQLQVFGTRLRPRGVLMQAEIKAMKPADMRAVAAYVQSL